MRSHLFYLFLIISFCGYTQFIEKQGDIKLNKGFFDFYYNESKDEIYLKVDHVDKEFLYVHSLATGVGSNDIGLDRGQIGNGVVVKFIKSGNKLLLVQPNKRYRAITDNTLERKSVAQAFASSVLYGFPIKQTKEDSYIINLTPFLYEDAHGISTRLKSQKEGVYVVDISRSALSLEKTRGFPENVEFEALLTYKGEPIGKNVRSVVPNPRFISVIQHHSFVKLPDDGYVKREFTPMSGALFTSYLDYATPIHEPIIKRYVNRHRLEKKYPAKLISEPKEPIIYYLDPGTPEPVRSALLEGARWWDEAFEAAGYKNAFQVKLLPENADPMDVRYNVIQWVHRSTRGWSYGASVKDPRTGEIIKGHVSLGSLRIRQDFLIAQALCNRPFKDQDDQYQPMLDMALARIRQLSAHEVGHTIGFAHNFAASTHSRASVMDYPHPQFNLQGDQIDFSNAYDVGIGEWDKVTVAYSYADFGNIADESKKLDSILSAAYKKGLRFISDQDARPRGGAHGLAHLWDNGANATDELDRLLKIRKIAIANFSKDNIRSREPYSVLEDVFVPLYFLHRYQTEAVVKQIGGFNYNYAVKGDGQMIMTPIPGNAQKKAMTSLLSTILPEELAIPQDKLALFPPRAYGYPRSRESFKSRTGVGFDAISAAMTASEMSLSLLLHPERVNRLIHQKSIDSEQLGLAELIDELLQQSLKRNHDNPYFKELQHGINAIVLKQLFSLGVHTNSYPQVRIMVTHKLRELGYFFSQQKGKSDDMYADYYQREITKFLEKPEQFKSHPIPKIPDGSPIGSYQCRWNHCY